MIPAVRFGLAWDVFGNGKTAMRTGFGAVRQPQPTATSQQLSPAIRRRPYNRTVYYSTIDKIPSFANNAAITPISPRLYRRHQKVQENYNGTFMIQQKAPLRNGTGSLLCVQFEQAHLGHPPTQPSRPIFASTTPPIQQPDGRLSAAQHAAAKSSTTIISVPCQGLGAITSNDLSGNSSYNSLQVTVRRNFTKHLSYGLAYTWSKTMSVLHWTGYPTTASPYFTDKFRNYGPSYQPTPHVIVVNYIYEVPNLGPETERSGRSDG